MRNLIFDFGNVLVRWEPRLVFVPYFGSEEKYRHFWDNVCDAGFRNRIDAGEDQAACIREQQQRFPDFAEPLAMYYSQWREMLPGEVPGMRGLVSRLKADPQNRLYGLTNWSMETFPAARRQFGILRLIDDYVVSGDVRMIKPAPEIFQLLLSRFSLKAEDCVFVDDNAANAEAASRLGMKGLVFHSAEELAEQLKSL